MKRSPLLVAALALLFGDVGRAEADYIATVTLDTTALTNNPGQGPSHRWASNLTFEVSWKMHGEKVLLRAVNDYQ